MQQKRHGRTDAKALNKALSRARNMSPMSASVHACQSPLDRKLPYRESDDYGLSDEGHKALHLARAVRLGCLADAYDAGPEDFVKEAALQLDLLLSGGDDDCKCYPPWTYNDFGHVHYYVQTLMLFLKMVSDESLIAATADACVKAMKYIGDYVNESKSLYEDSDAVVPFEETREIKAFDTISSLCERIIMKADAPVVDPADGTRKPPKRNRAEYEGDFARATEVRSS
eukprot:3042729-Prymnesium_polylepis.1